MALFRRAFLLRSLAILLFVGACFAIYRWPARYSQPDIWLGGDLVAMALLGGIVSAHAPSDFVTKVVYVSIFMVLAVLGMRLVIRQSNDTAQADKDFKNTLKDIAKSSAETARIQKLNTELQESLLAQSGTITSLAKETIGQITGGNTYAYLAPLKPMSLPNQMMLSQTILRVIGNDPLHNLHIEVFSPEGRSAEFDYGTVLSTETRRTRSYPGLMWLSASNSLQIFHIFINASNGSLSEVIRFQQLRGEWQCNVNVSKYVIQKGGHIAGRTLQTWNSNGKGLDWGKW